MKILLTMNLPYSRWSGGANRANRFLLEELAARGHETMAVVPALAEPARETEGELLARLTHENVNVTRENQALRYSSRGVAVHAVLKREVLRNHLRGEMKRFAPEVVLVSSEDQSQLLLDLALSERKGKVVYLAHTPQMFPFGPESLHPGRARAEMIRAVSGIVAISQAVRSYIHQHLGMDAFVTHPPLYGSSPFQRCASFSSQSVLLLNACAVKGISIFLALAERFPDVQFIAVPGYGTTAADLAALNGLGNVSIRPNAATLDELLTGISVALMPTLWMEGFGMAAVDAMLRGIPVLAAAHGGLVEAKLGTAGLLPVRPINRYQDRLDDALLPAPEVPEQYIDSWSEALAALLRDRSSYERLSDLSFEAAQRFVNSLTISPLESWLAKIAESSTLPFGLRVSESTSDDLEARINALSSDKRAVLLQRLIELGFGAPATRPASRVLPDQPLPLSWSQEGVWVAQQRDPNSCAYNLSSIFLLTGDVSADRLRSALHKIRTRHSILRTTYQSIGGIPRQVIHLNVQTEIDVLDMSGASTESREKGLLHLERWARIPFRLEHDAPIRLGLIRISSGQWLLGVTLHHICCDGSSLKILARELSDAYESSPDAGDGKVQSSGVAQYVDYAVEQRTRETEEGIAADVDYWSKQLRGLRPLRLGREIAAIDSNFRAGVSLTSLPLDLTTRLRRVGRAHGCSIFPVLLAGVVTSLHLWTGQQDIAVATDLANRANRMWQDVVGLIANQALLRFSINSTTVVRSFLDRTARMVAEALDHQTAPWERICEVLPSSRDRKGLLPYQAKLVHGVDSVDLKIAGAEVRELSRPRAMAKCDLTFFTEDLGESIGFQIEYNSDVIDEVTIHKCIGLLPVVYESLASDSTDSIGSLIRPSGTQTPLFEVVGR